MKIHPAPSRPAAGRLRRRLASILLVAALGLGGGSVGMRAAAGALDIDVRSSVDDLWDGVHKRDAKPHGKVYGIASVRLAPAQYKLVKPVNEAGMVRQLRHELNKRGFVEMQAGQKPDVVLIVVYGRGWLRNPYLDGVMVDEVSNGVPTVTIITPEQVFKQLEADFENKLQRAEYEKLFIAITAYRYPEAPREKPRKLWSTQMIVDDPEHRDLNQAYEAMLAAGADYFDRQIDKEQVTISSPDPQTSVKLGPLNVIELGKPAPPPDGK